MKKAIALSTAALLSCSLLNAADVKVDGKDAGDVELQLKAMHILHDKTNGFAPNNGSGYLMKLKYDTPDILTDGLKLGVGMYVNGDTGATAWDSSGGTVGYPFKYKPARGMFVAQRGDSKAILGEAYLAYKNDMLHAKVGRQILHTPLTKIKWSLMPNFYEAAVVGTKTGGLALTAAHINKMSFGSRSATDWGLIGEGTGTAGTAINPIEESGSNNAISQAKFYNMGVAALGTGQHTVHTDRSNKTDGITAIGIGYKMDSLDVNLWAYKAHEIAYQYYVDANYGMKVSEGMKATLSGQYLIQRDTGSELAGDVNFHMSGAKVALGSKKLGAYAAYNQSCGNDQFINAWGADPAYTSSIFSRNAYRQDVKAYKVGGHYNIMKGLKFMASYAQYGQSQTTISKGTRSATDNAYEADFVLVYKPTKAWMFKIFDAWRVSEYNRPTNERRQNHVRAVASYTF